MRNKILITILATILLGGVGFSLKSFAAYTYSGTTTTQTTTTTTTTPTPTPLPGFCCCPDRRCHGGLTSFGCFNGITCDPPGTIGLFFDTSADTCEEYCATITPTPTPTPGPTPCTQCPADPSLDLPVGNVGDCQCCNNGTTPNRCRAICERELNLDGSWSCNWNTRVTCFDPKTCEANPLGGNAVCLPGSGIDECNPRP